MNRNWIKSSRLIYTHSPEVVDQDVEDAEDNNQEGGAVLGLETDNDHDASASSQEANHNTPDGPLAAEDEADEEEDQENTTSQLEVHLPVLLINLGETGKGLGLADPGIGQNHEKTADDGQVSEEEVEVEDQAVSKSLGDNDAHEAGHSVIRVFPGDDEDGAEEHGEHIGD